MDRQIVDSLLDELEKIAALYDPAIHTNPEALERLRRMEELQLQHRVRTSRVPIREFGISQVPSLIKENPVRAKVMQGGYWTEGTPSGPVVYRPTGIAEKIAPATAGLPSAGTRMAKPVLMHHELDEAAEMARKYRKAIESGVPPTQFDWGPRAGREMMESVPGRLRGPVSRTVGRVVEKLPESAQAAVRAASRLPSPVTAAHMDPRILIQESNRVARLDPESRAKMLKLRSRTREARLMRDLGLRYGEETIPESGRRFERLRGAMQHESEISKRAPFQLQKKVNVAAREGGEALRKSRVGKLLRRVLGR